MLQNINNRIPCMDLSWSQPVHNM